jgi:hypothetical protein
MDIGRCSEVSYGVSMDGFASVEECECKFSDCLLVVLAELVKVFIELGDFGLDVVGYVFVDIFVAKVLLDTLFDEVSVEMITDPIFLSAQMMMIFLFWRRRWRAVFCWQEMFGREYLLNLDCSAVRQCWKWTRAVSICALALGGSQEGFRMYSCGMNSLLSS